jgi:hypothetical protein
LVQRASEEEKLQMTRIKLLLAALVVTAAVGVVPAGAAPTLHVVAAGSSAMYQGFGVAVVNDVAVNTSTFTGGGSIHHYTVTGAGGSCTGNCAQLFDSRGATETEQAKFWAVWVCASANCTGSDASDVWVYNQVDSTVGVRMFLARPPATVQLHLGAQIGQDQIKPVLFKHGVASGSPTCTGGATTCDDTSIPADVAAVINGASVNAGATDIRPEDALYATNRTLAALDSSAPWIGLGYGPGPFGVPIASGQPSSTATAVPAVFALPGNNDPITNNPVPSTITTLSVGESPIVFIVNNSNTNGLGNHTGAVPFYSNVADNGPPSPVGTQSPLGRLFGGVDCGGDNAAFGLSGATPAGNFALAVQLREPLSGTMNTTEFSSFNTFGGQLPTVAGSSVGNSPLVTPGTSQEANVGGTAHNPLSALPCTVIGTRTRAIGTGEEVGKLPNIGVAGHQDAIGYTFFSFGNVANLGAGVGRYLKLDGVDPIFASYSGGDPGQPATTSGTVRGTTPTCNVALGNAPGGCTVDAVWSTNLALCPDGHGCSFPHLRDGTYRSWSLLRVLCDSTDVNCTDTNFGTTGVIYQAQQDLHNSDGHSVADFLPFDNQGAWNLPFGDASFVRSHYAFKTTVGTNNNRYPVNHANVQGPAITATFPTVGAQANLPSDTNGTGTVPEVGGDAGGCIIPTTNTGGLVTVSASLYPAPVNGKVKFFIAQVPGSKLMTGVCDSAAASPAFPGMKCTTSNQAPVLNSSCGTASTCNPGPQGDSVSVVGMSNNLMNGDFQITRFVNPGQIKVKAPIGRSGDPAGYVTLNSQNGVMTWNTGCAQ